MVHRSGICSRGDRFAGCSQCPVRGRCLGAAAAWRRVQGRVRRRRLARCPRAGQLSGACAAGVPRFRMHRPRHASDRAPAKFTGGLPCWPRFSVRAQSGAAAVSFTRDSRCSSSSSTRRQGLVRHVAERSDTRLVQEGAELEPNDLGEGQVGATGDARCTHAAEWAFPLPTGALGGPNLCRKRPTLALAAG